MGDVHESWELVLASSSPRRRDLLRQANIDFRVLPPEIHEPADTSEHETPRHMAEALAYFKAKAVRPHAPRAMVLGADTVVAHGEHILGKADDADHARHMLRTLSGTRHEVITGVALLGPRGQRLLASDVTYVTMREMTDEEVEAYVASGEWIDKAGAYAIQETADRYVVQIEGSFDNVAGLPVDLVRQMLAQLPHEPPECEPADNGPAQ